jgi:hypothetical protein
MYVRRRNRYSTILRLLRGCPNISGNPRHFPVLHCTSVVVDRPFGHNAFRASNADGRRRVDDICDLLLSRLITSKTMLKIIYLCLESIQKLLLIRALLFEKYAQPLVLILPQKSQIGWMKAFTPFSFLLTLHCFHSSYLYSITYSD